jgi:hypothetical protein
MANLRKYEHIKHENYDFCHRNEKKINQNLVLLKVALNTINQTRPTKSLHLHDFRIDALACLTIYYTVLMCSNVPCIFIYREDELFPDNFVICLVDQ